MTSSSTVVLSEAIDMVINSFNSQMNSICEKLLKTRLAEIETINDNFKAIEERLNKLSTEIWQQRPTKSSKLEKSTPKASKHSKRQSLQINNSS